MMLQIELKFSNFYSFLKHLPTRAFSTTHVECLINGALSYLEHRSFNVSVNADDYALVPALKKVDISRVGKIRKWRVTLGFFSLNQLRKIS